MPRRRLHVLGQSLEVEATMALAGRGDEHLGEVPPDSSTAKAKALLTAARGISDAVMDRVRGRERAHGRSTTCREGCASCCHQLVPVSTLEAAHLWRVVEALPAARRSAVERRFDDAIRRLTKAKLLDPESTSTMRAPSVREGESLWDATSRRYRELSIACPLLEDRRCAVYAERPIVCREYAVSSPPEHCARPQGQGVVALPRPVRMSEVLADTLHGLAPDAVSTTMSIPLALALAWASAHRAELDAALERDTTTIAQTLLDMIEVDGTDNDVG